MKKLIILLMIGLFLFGCTETEENSLVIEKGDVALVDYITYLENGTIIDTSLEYVALENNINKKEYAPLTVPILENNGYIRGFTLGLVGLENGSNETLIIFPEMAYGKINEDEIFYIPKFYPIELIEEVNKTRFDEELEIGETILEQTWNSTVIEKTEETYIFKREPKINQTFIHMGIEHLVTEINETHVIFEVKLEEGGKHFFEHPGTHNLAFGRVSEIKEGIITIDFNPELAGKIIYMDVWVRNITKRQ